MPGHVSLPVVLVTGSEGLIGDAIVRSLSSRYRIVGLDIARPTKDPVIEDFIDCDLTKDASVARALDTVRQRHGVHLSSVIHLAAHYDFSGKPSSLYKQLTVEGTGRLLAGLRSFQVEQFVFSSTLIVMEPADEEGEVITETSPVKPTWEYPRSKIWAERRIKQERGSIPAAILRIGGVYDRDCHAVPVAQQMSRIYEKKLESLFFPGDADHGQAFVHVEDLVECFQRVIELRSKLDSWELFLIAEPEVMSYAELQERLGELIHGKEWPAIRIPKAVAKAGAWVRERLAGDGDTFIKPWMIDLADDHYPVSIARARSRLGWEPKHRLRDTLPEMAAALLRDPPYWYQINGLTLPDREKEAEPAHSKS